jgi:hydroxyacylglutathione hydrolase
LADDVLVYPAHGAGSACGKNMSSETWDTLGNQKKTNYALRADMTKKEFVKEVTDGLAPPPIYFQKNAALNKAGYESIDTVMKRGAKSLSPREFEVVANETDALILDVRSKEEFVKGFIPNSIFIGLDGSFAPWVGALVTDLMQPIIIVAPKGKNKETVKRLARVGYDNSVGYLKGGFEAWKKEEREIDTIETIDVKTFEKKYSKKIHVLDVRKPTEYIGEQIENAQNFPLDFINDNMSEISKKKKYYMHCRSGYRSTVTASILKSRGFDKIVNVQGKYDDISASKVPTSDFVCPSTLK